MRNKVVYILGAGFSAPLGIPVMDNFIFEAKDMCFSDSQDYSHFTNVFDRIESMSKIKNAYRADLYNIEEVLSILEMDVFLDDSPKTTDDIQTFIKDVIKYYTPDFPDTPQDLHSGWGEVMFTNERSLQRYGFFLGNLLNLKVTQQLNRNPEPEDLKISSESTGERYGAISMNYDLVVEKVMNYLKRNFDLSDEINLSYSSRDRTEDKLNFPLAKLHGSVGGDLDIIPPTWNKSSAGEVLETWELAKSLLEDANKIRILGYSLPDTDSYINYLLKSSQLNNEHLKQIDVICLDDGGVKARYDEFIHFKNYRFKDGNIVDYLDSVKNKTRNSRDSTSENYLLFDDLEQAHEDFMQGEVV
jgi:hypothetical protein